MRARGARGVEGECARGACRCVWGGVWGADKVPLHSALWDEAFDQRAAAVKAGGERRAGAALRPRRDRARPCAMWRSFLDRLIR